MADEIRYSIIVPVLNEEANIPPLSAELFRTMDSLGDPYEVIFVDDGSTDGSAGQIRRLAAEKEQVRLIRFRKNFGQSAALTAGVDHSRGDVVISMDADLQNDPADIPRMLRILEEGHDVVCGWRRDRKDRALSRRIPSRLANGLIRWLTGVRMHDYGCTLKVFRSEVIKRLPLYGGLHRYVPALAAEHGARITETAVNHRPRGHGESKYSIARTFPVFMDLLLVLFTLRFSRRPFYFFGGLGITLSFIGALLLGYLAVLKIAFGQPIGGRPLLVFGAIFLLGGIQVLSLGLLAGLLYRFHVESKTGALYSILEIVGGREGP